MKSQLPSYYCALFSAVTKEIEAGQELLELLRQSQSISEVSPLRQSHTLTVARRQLAAIVTHLIEAQQEAEALYLEDLPTDEETRQSQVI
ncbi:MAG TPA: hypothetical protein H9687_01365 [Firmicutes bacterium]|nr:hypothetical protein [Bacillota bacterium]